MKIDVYNKFKLETTQDVASQKQLENIFGKCFLVLNWREPYHLANKNVWLWSEQYGLHTTKRGSCYITHYKKEELKNFIVSETTADKHIKFATLKYGLKKYYEN